MQQQPLPQVSRAWVPAQLPRAPSFACSEQFSLVETTSPSESCSPLNGLCPILNQITGEQAANYKTSGILIYLRYVKFSPAHQSTGEELLNHLTKISCESVKRGKLRHRMPGGFWSGSRWKALPEGGIPQVPRVIPAHKLSSLSPGHQGSQTPHIH